MKNNKWTELSFEKSKDTFETIHLWTQIIGKIKVALNPWINHSWHATLEITTNGLSSGAIFTEDKQFEIRLNFLEHRLEIFSSADEKESFDLESLKVSSCYEKVLGYFNKMGVKLEINPVPNEIEDAVAFDENNQGTYNTQDAIDLHKVLLKINRVFTQYRSEFIGKSSPVQFFWGSFDLSVARFSGQKAPLHPGGIPNLPNWVAQEAYNHEVMNCGFWSGNEATPFAAFYSYIYPAPEGFKNASIKPDTAYYDDKLGEFILKYEDVQKADNPAEILMEFLHSSYDTAADLAGWDKEKFRLKLNKN